MLLEVEENLGGDEFQEGFESWESFGESKQKIGGGWWVLWIAER